MSRRGDESVGSDSWKSFQTAECDIEFIELDVECIELGIEFNE